MIEHKTWVVPADGEFGDYRNKRVFAAVEGTEVLSVVLADESLTPPILTHVYTIPARRGEGVYQGVLSWMRELGYPMFHNNNMPPSYLVACFNFGILPHPSIAHLPPALKTYSQLESIQADLYSAVTQSVPA